MHQFSFAYHSSYVRNWRVLGAIWVLFALSATILQILVFIHPAWIGNEEGGYFGLYDYCSTSECTWNILRVRPLSFSFEIAAFLVLAATVLTILAVFSILLLILLRDRYVFLLCSWMHMFSFIAMLTACSLFPNGWENPRVREVCDSKKYNIGMCHLRWPYLLALVLVVDQLCLSLLGFVLACRQPPNIPEVHPFASELDSSIYHFSR
ncbi:unnamed protein product [Auanema sp. JU1783]|nr:unnamed protein product [Auanema sp. JU1783]